MRTVPSAAQLLCFKHTRLTKRPRSLFPLTIFRFLQGQLRRNIMSTPSALSTTAFPSSETSASGTMPKKELVQKLARDARDITANRFKILRKSIGDAEVVMIGEATHGTQDFYKLRAELTKVLIEEEGFNIVALEADWPSVYRLQRFASSGKACKDERAEDAFNDFQRFPKWMWRNKPTLDFVKWLHQYNSSIPTGTMKCGIYGLDLYSWFESADMVLRYLERVDKDAATAARERYGTISLFRHEPQEYAMALARGYPSAAPAMFNPPRREFCCGYPWSNRLGGRLKGLAKKYLRGQGGFIDGEEYFYTKENAKLVVDAEEYYRNTFAGGAKTWNLRDKHMMRTLLSLMSHYEKKIDKLADIETFSPTSPVISASPSPSPSPSSVLPGDKSGVRLVDDDKPKVRVVVWAHNSHLGDAKATDMGMVRKELNLGQLVREHFGLTRSYNVGMTCYTGTVRAADRWGDMGRIMQVNPALTDSIEELLHHTHNQLHRRKYSKDAVDSNSSSDSLALNPSFGLVLRSNCLSGSDPSSCVSSEVLRELSVKRLQRFIGVLYMRHQEFWSHYSECVLPKQFDSLIHIDTAYALEPFGLPE